MFYVNILTKLSFLHVYTFFSFVSVCTFAIWVSAIQNATSANLSTIQRQRKIY